MKKVGLTGGIGSGKTTVAGLFAELGVPVYNSDKEAKRLMRDDAKLKGQILDLFGQQAYRDGELNRRHLAEVVFSNPDQLKQLNALVHPAVRNDFNRWSAAQQGPYVIQEAAILFENGSYPAFDHMILVTAPRQLRISRLKERDGSTEAEIMARMGQQWEDAKKVPLAHFVIENISLDKTRARVGEVHKMILSSP